MPVWFKLFALQVCIFLLPLLAATSAAAHVLNQSYVYFNVSEDSLTGRIEINTRDLARVFDREDPNPQPWTKEEVTAATPTAVSMGLVIFICSSFSIGSGKASFVINH